MKTGFVQLVFLLTATTFLSPVFAAPLTIDSYVDEVEGKNLAVIGAKAGKGAARVQSDNSHLYFLPTFSASAEADTSHADTFMGALYGTQQIKRIYNAGIDETTSFGLKGNLGYNFTYQDVTGADPGILPVTTYYSAAPTLTLTQSLWRNWAGVEDRATEQKAHAQAEADYFDNLNQYRTGIKGARDAYLNVYFQRRMLAALNESLGLTNRLREFAKTRANNQLGDASDYLQTDANYRTQELQLVKTQIDLKNSVLAFNSLRNIDSDELAEELTPPELKIPDLKNIDKLVRIDLLKTSRDLDIAKSATELQRQLATPTIELYGNYGYTDVDLNASTTLGNSFGRHDVYGYGIRFRSPIYFGTTTELRRSLQTSIEANEKKLARQSQENSRNRTTLVKQIENARERLDLSQKLQQVQKQKFENEERRHRTGRTTLFQVLQFQQDYLKAELDEIQIEQELHQHINELGLYDTQSEKL